MTARLAPSALQHQRASGARRTAIEQPQQPLNINQQHEGAEHEPSTTPPLIYVASLADYVAGHLTGEWIDPARDTDDVAEDIHNMLAGSITPEAEEWAIHDHQGFGVWQPSEYEDIATVCRVAAAIVEKGADLSDWIAYLGDASEEAVNSYDDAYWGNWPSMTAYVDNLLDENGLEITTEPAHFQRYVHIDTDAIARDLEIEMHVVQQPDGSFSFFDPGAAQ